MAIDANVAHARSVVDAAFAMGTVPAPYYLHVLMRAQAARMPVAVGTGCAGPATAGGSTRVQRFTAQHKGPTATRSAWVWRKVRVMRTVQGKQVMREFWVQTRSKQVVVP